MARKLKAFLSPIASGVQYVKLASWREFYPYVNETLSSPKDYIFRGQRLSRWKLETSLDRALQGLGPRLNAARLVGQHLYQFRLATRGRRGVNPKALVDDNERWALGQHYGLWTPLLDWTESPFVALYFAFEEPNEARSGARAVFALSRPLVESRSGSIAAKQQVGSVARADIVEIIVPETDENARLVSQGGLFTRGTTGVHIERWVRTYFRGSKASTALVKIIVPEKKGERVEILRTLNRMNINHRSLFPDVEGSAKFCNMRLSVTGY